MSNERFQTAVVRAMRKMAAVGDEPQQYESDTPVPPKAGNLADFMAQGSQTPYQGSNPAVPVGLEDPRSGSTPGGLRTRLDNLSPEDQETLKYAPGGWRNTATGAMNDQRVQLAAIILGALGIGGAAYGAGKMMKKKKTKKTASALPTPAQGLAFLRQTSGR